MHSSYIACAVRAAESKGLNQSGFTAQCRWGVGKIFFLCNMAASASWEDRKEKRAAGEMKSYIQRESVREWLGFCRVRRKAPWPQVRLPPAVKWAPTQATKPWWRVKRFRVQLPPLRVNETQGKLEGRWKCKNVPFSVFFFFKSKLSYGQMEVSAEHKETGSMTQKKYFVHLWHWSCLLYCASSAVTWTSVSLNAQNIFGQQERAEVEVDLGCKWKKKSDEKRPSEVLCSFFWIENFLL